MTTAPNLADIRRTARLVGCVIADRDTRYLVFRITRVRPVFIGARSSLSALRDFMRRIAKSK